MSPSDIGNVSLSEGLLPTVVELDRQLSRAFEVTLTRESRGIVLSLSVRVKPDPARREV